MSVIQGWPYSDWQYALFSLPTRSPQESEFQETVSDRSDSRGTEDGGLSGMENNTGFLLYFSLLSSSPPLFPCWSWWYIYKENNRLLWNDLLCPQCVKVSLNKYLSSITSVLQVTQETSHCPAVENTDKEVRYFVCECVLARMSGRSWELAVTLAMSLGAKQWEGWSDING